MSECSWAGRSGRVEKDGPFPSPAVLNRAFECFCKDAFLDWMLFECLKWDVYQRITFILQTNPPKHKHKNIMKA